MLVLYSPQPWLVPVLQVSADGLLCCTISNDQSVKVYDVVNFDMMVMLRLPYIPGAVEWVYKLGDLKAKLAISDRDSPFVYIYDIRAGTNEPIISKKVYIVYISINMLMIVKGGDRNFGEEDVNQHWSTKEKETTTFFAWMYASISY